MMAVKISVALPLLLLISLNGVCPQTPREVYVKVGEMAALQCPYYRRYTHGDARLIWTSHTFQKIYPSNNTSSAEQMGVLVHGRSLVILSASVNHQGNYSCSLGNGSRQFWFRLMVYTAHNKTYEAKTTYSLTCYTHESCTLKCPDVNTPAVNILNITSYGIIWTKVGESLPKADYISSVEETDHGVYTCTRSYLYYGKIYNMTFTVALDVQPGKKVGEAVILSPHGNEVFDADLGSTLVIDCKAVMYSDFDEVFWLIEESFVDTDSNLPVFYNYTRDSNTNEIKMKASLVFKKVSVEDLSKRYTCKLDTDNQPSRSVTVTLAKKASSFFSMALGIGIITVVVTLVAAVICIKLKMDLFRRDTYACYRSVSDGHRHRARP